MKKMIWISLTTSLFSFQALAANLPSQKNSIFISPIPNSWKMVTKKSNSHSRLVEYIPRNEKAGHHSKIIVQLFIRKAKNKNNFFSLYNTVKLKTFEKVGCEVKSLSTDAFKKQNRPYKAFTYECPQKKISGVDVIYDADDSTIYDTMYEFSTDKLSSQQVTEAVNLLNSFKICTRGDAACLKENG